MDIELLKTFLEVKQTRHFGRAAENLYLTQAAVSARIKQLESQLGSNLFTRYRNNLQLTSSGERLAEHAESILTAWERAKADVSQKKSQCKVFSLGATSGLWDLLLQDALNQIHLQLAKIALSAESHSQEVLIRRLMERTLDLCLIYEPAKISELVSVEVAHTELVLVSTEKSQDLQGAINNSHVNVDWGPVFELNYAQYYQPTSPPVLHTTLARIALEFILYHGGNAYLPLKMISGLLDKRLFRVESAPVFNRPIFACYHKENRDTKTIEQIIDLFVAQQLDQNETL
jgi:LysR family transcriptional regulator, flagellar master operon regulator